MKHHIETTKVIKKTWDRKAKIQVAGWCETECKFTWKNRLPNFRILMFQNCVHTDISTHHYFFTLQKKLILSYEADNSRYFKTTEILKYWLFSVQTDVNLKK